MPNQQLYVVDYLLHGAPRSFVLRHPGMNNAEAWHWASCDAGFGHIPRGTNDKTKKETRATAERFGVERVMWRVAGMRPPATTESSTSIA